MQMTMPHGLVEKLVLIAFQCNCHFDWVHVMFFATLILCDLFMVILDNIIIIACDIYDWKKSFMIEKTNC